jgi:hypothetical protein
MHSSVVFLKKTTPSINLFGHGKRGFALDRTHKPAQPLPKKTKRGPQGPRLCSSEDTKAIVKQN